ncbi:MAG: HAD family hydrolase [DPANN group archaeon]|nr:HAD family hydrolase [DPANN group archaeon]
MLKPRKTIICLDLDGTLLDSTETYVAAYNKSFEKNNLPTRSREEIVKHFGLPGIQIVKNLFPSIPERKILKVTNDKIEIVLDETFKLTKQFPNVPEAVEKLRQKYFVAIVSNGLHDEIIALLKYGGLSSRMFDAIVCAQEVAHAKPDADEIFKAEKKLGAKVEWMVGDTVYDMIAGKAAGVKTCAVLSGIHDLKKLGSEKPTLVVQSVAFLPDALFGSL